MDGQEVAGEVSEVHGTSKVDGLKSWDLGGLWIINRHLGAISRKLGARRELNPGDSRDREWHMKERRQESEYTHRCEDSDLSGPQIFPG